MRSLGNRRDVAVLAEPALIQDGCDPFLWTYGLPAVSPFARDEDVSILCEVEMSELRSRRSKVRKHLHGTITFF